MFPLRDENPTELTPVVTFVFIALNSAAWLLVQGGGGAGFLDSLCVYGSIPANLTGVLPSGELLELGPDAACRVGELGWATILTSMFMHGGWGHLIGNMWFLWVFGNNIEDSMGHVRFVLFYLLCGVAASVAHLATDPGSAVPTVGASGAISGVMGAYLVLYPKVRVQTFIFLFVYVTVIALPAWILLIEWLVLQVIGGFGTLGGEGGGVAFWAHIGGFAAGVIGVKLFQRPQLVEAKRRHVQLTPDQVRRLRW